VAAVSAIVRDISEREKTAQAQALLASIVEFSDDAIHSVSLDGTVVSWNRGAEEMFGYSRDEIIDKSIAVLVPQERRDEMRQFFGAILEGCAVSPFEAVLQGKDGRAIDASLSLSPRRNSAGEVIGAAAIIRDVGQQRLAERKLKESEERFREIFEHAPFGMSVTGLDERYIQVNGALCRMLGYSEKELVGTSWTDLTHPDDLAASLRRGKQLREETIGYVEAEKRYIHRNGEVVWARLRKSAMRDSGGKPQYFVVHLEDITETKRTEEALYESDDRFRVMADSFPTMMWVTNADGGNQFINRSYREFCGMTNEQMDGDKWQSLIHPDDAPGYVEAFYGAVRDHLPFKAEVRLRRADGEWRLLGSYAEPRLSPSGAFLGHVGLSSDITDRRREEQALQNSEEKFRQLAENMRDVVWMVPHAANETLYVSPAYEKVTAYILGQRDLLVTALRELLETAVKFSELGGTVRLACDSTPGALRISIESRGRTIPPCVIPNSSISSPSANIQHRPVSWDWAHPWHTASWRCLEAR